MITCPRIHASFPLYTSPEVLLPWGVTTIWIFSKLLVTSLTVMSTVYVSDPVVDDPTVTTSLDVEVQEVKGVAEVQEMKGDARSCSSLRCAIARASARIAAAELYFTAYTKRGKTPLEMIIINTSAMQVSTKVKPRWSLWIGRVSIKATYL